MYSFLMVVAFAIVLLSIIALITFGLMLATEKQHKKAREGGCICTRGDFVIWERSDCPYCNK